VFVTQNKVINKIVHIRTVKLSFSVDKY